LAPKGDKPLGTYSYTYGAYSKDAMERRITWICERVPAAYEWMVERNFPTLKNSFPSYQIFPFRFRVIFDGIEDSAKGGALDLFLESTRDSQRPIVHYSRPLDAFYVERGVHRSSELPQMSLGRWANHFDNDDILIDLTYRLIERDFNELFGDLAR
jgi:hypothetical protein